MEIETKYTTQSNLLRCYRTIGAFAGTQPATCHIVGKALHLMVPIDRSFISYDITRKIDFLYRSVDFAEKIQSVHMRNYTAIVVTEHSVYIESEIKSFDQIEIAGTISSSLLFGQHLLITTENYMTIIDVENKSIFKKIKIPCQSPKIFHPREYLNKVLLISENQMFLMNINTEKVLFTFTFAEKIVDVAQSPDVDVHAIALANNEIVLHDIRQNKRIGVMINSEKPTRIGFVNGLPNDDLFLIVGSEIGMINVLSIKNNTIIGTLFQHTKRVHTIITFPNELHFVTVGEDNAIRQYMIDPNCGTLVPNMIRERSGHPEKPIYVKITGNNVVTGSRDGSLRVSSLFDPMLTKELSQKIQQKAKRNAVENSKMKLSPVNCIDINERYFFVRNTIVSTHERRNVAVTWDEMRYRIGENKFMTSIVDKTDPSKRKHSSAQHLERNGKEYTQATSCCFSHCGNFVLVGNNNGIIDKFNVQSGEHKLLFSQHKQDVVAIAVDADNRYVVSASMDGTVLLWSFETGEVVSKLFESEDSVTHFTFNKKNNLCAIVTSANELFIIDITTKRIIRKMQLNMNVSCIQFNPKGNYVFVAYINSYLHVIDIITMKVVDYIQFKSAIISMDMSENGQYFVCYTVDEFELQTYYLRDYFSTVLLDTPVVPYRMKFVHLQSNNVPMKRYCYDDIVIKSKSELIEIKETAKLLEATYHEHGKWINLPDLDRLRKEMQLEQTKSTKEEIPFFISFDKSVNNVFKPVQFDREVVKNEPLMMKSSLTQHLDGNDEDILNYLMSLNSSLIDLEIRNLSTGNYHYLNAFLTFLNNQLNTYRNYDFIITIVQVTLRTHIRELMKNEKKYHQQLSQLKQTIEQLWCPVDELFNTDFSLIAFLSGIKV